MGSIFIARFLRSYRKNILPSFKKKQQTKKVLLCGFLQEPKWNLQFFKKEALTTPDKIRRQEYDNFVSILPTIIIFVNGGI